MGQAAELIDLIYDAPFTPGAWNVAIEQLCDAIGAETAVTTELDIVTGEGAGQPVRQDPAVMEEYLSRWAADNPLAIVDDPVQYMRGWLPTIVRDAEWMDRDELRKTPYFNEFLARLGAEQSMFLRLGLDGTMVSSISIARQEDRGAFSKDEIAIARRYQPHLVRASAITRRLRVEQNARDDLDAMLDTTDQRLLFVDRAGRVQRMTAAARRFVSEEGALDITGGQLRTMDAASDAHLQRLYAAVLAGKEMPPALTLGRTGSTRRFAVTVSPVGARSRAMLSSEPLMLVSVNDAQPPALGAELDARARFNLTAAEGRLATAIAEGQSLREAADRIGVSVHTVRAQLSAVFAKTGTRRQADLVRLLLHRS
ncbi:helix-turn-helix transcriptional regulator [Sphingomonas panacisoli]|uniref:Helix-turn-helix transcriptional regulator n=1 Tax=Sphingomonas panacisoli TaxID=1813879 RepID=A0A5B8LLC0_9SPHN|nr:helix-turn-helix transcriptional regulator [Sphingomonas panacisoli]QDZ07850.1 helix-turn-helix transcriptional regulator [Sphingomonas panacisoli]